MTSTSSSPTTALVTGSTSGIGRATAIALAATGIHVAVSGRDKARGDLTVQTQSTGRGSFVGFRPKLAVLSEIVPEKCWTGPPFRRRPAAQITHFAVAWVQHAKRESSSMRIRAFEFRIAHQQSL